MMDRDQIRQAIHTLQAQGDPVTGPKVRELIGGKGSFREIYQVIEEERQHQAGSSRADVQRVIMEDPDPADEPPPDPVAEAEAVLQQAQAQVQQVEVELPALEDALALARDRLLAAVCADEGAQAAVRRGLLPRSDPAIAETEAQVKATTRAFQEVQWRVDQARQRLTAWHQRVAQAQQQLALAQRDAYVRREAPDLWARVQEARTAYAPDPLLRGSMGHAASDVQRSRWAHDHRLSELESELAALLEAATTQGLVPEDPRPPHQRKLVTRSRTWL
jgi:Plasmid replication region DNA-binding N-term